MSNGSDQTSRQGRTPTMGRSDGPGPSGRSSTATDQVPTLNTAFDFRSAATDTATSSPSPSLPVSTLASVSKSGTGNTTSTDGASSEKSDAQDSATSQTKSSPEEDPATHTEARNATIRELSKHFKTFNDELAKPNPYDRWFLDEEKINDLSKRYEQTLWEEADGNFRKYVSDFNVLSFAFGGFKNEPSADKTRHHWCSWLHKKFDMPRPAPLKPVKSMRKRVPRGTGVPSQASQALLFSPSSSSLSNIGASSQAQPSQSNALAGIGFPGSQNGFSVPISSPPSSEVTGDSVMDVKTSFRSLLLMLLIQLDEKMRSHPEFKPWIISDVPGRLGQVVEYELNETKDAWKGDVLELKNLFQGKVDYHKDLLEGWNEVQCRAWCSKFHVNYPKCDFPVPSPTNTLDSLIKNKTPEEKPPASPPVGAEHARGLSSATDQLNGVPSQASKDDAKAPTLQSKNTTSQDPGAAGASLMPTSSPRSAVQPGPTSQPTTIASRTLAQPSQSVSAPTFNPQTTSAESIPPISDALSASLKQFALPEFKPSSLQQIEAKSGPASNPSTPIVSNATASKESVHEDTASLPMPDRPAHSERVDSTSLPASQSSPKNNALEELLSGQLRIPAHVLSIEGGKVLVQISLDDVELLKNIRNHEEMVHNIQSGGDPALAATLDRMRATQYSLANVEDLHRDERELIECLNNLFEKRAAASREEVPLGGEALVGEFAQQEPPSQQVSTTVAENVQGIIATRKTVVGETNRGYTLHAEEPVTHIDVPEEKTLEEKPAAEKTEPGRSRDETVVRLKNGKLHLSSKVKLTMENQSLVIDAICAYLQRSSSTLNDVKQTAIYLSGLLFFKQKLEYEWRKKEALPSELLEAAEAIARDIPDILQDGGWKNQRELNQVVNAIDLCYKVITSYLGDPAPKDCTGVKAITQLLSGLWTGKEKNALDRLNSAAKDLNETPPGHSKDDSRKKAVELRKEYFDYLNKLLPKIQGWKNCLKSYLDNLHTLSEYMNSGSLRELLNEEFRRLDDDFGKIKIFFEDKDVHVYDDITFVFPEHAREEMDSALDEDGEL
ncbi:hypothetical protein BDV96DRAFT_598937 [Lophiotrema nucula]|uniref:Uncharacterized protein n=1 Tax=Lophiotrema nucula TaxID=690887 RepID=A0A6A5ZAF6_9PLEO|nr:hypothetical protein BDV96DRAFT_598937 [Lophiotrema nucula]